MFSIWDQKLSDLRDTTAGNTPVATSGAISVVCAVYACSLLRMSVAISRKQAGALGKRRLDRIGERLAFHSNRLSGLADKDITVFHAFLSSFTEDSSTIQEKRLRDQLIGIRRMQSVNVSMQTAEEIISIYTLIEELMPLCKHNVMADLVTAADLCNSAQRAVLLNARVNARGLGPFQESNLMRATTVFEAISKQAAGRVRAKLSPGL